MQSRPPAGLDTGYRVLHDRGRGQVAADPLHGLEKHRWISLAGQTQVCCHDAIDPSTEEVEVTSPPEDWYGVARRGAQGHLHTPACFNEWMKEMASGNSTTPQMCAIEIDGDDEAQLAIRFRSSDDSGATT